MPLIKDIKLSEINLSEETRFVWTCKCDHINEDSEDPTDSGLLVCDACYQSYNLIEDE